MVEGVRKHSELRLCGMAQGVDGDFHPEAGKNLAAEFGAPPYFEDYRRMLDEVRPDIVCVNSRYDMNGPVSAECLRRGIHCFTEKSVALSFDTLSELKAAAKSGGAKIAGMHAMRYDPEFFAAWEALQSGVIGNPRIITVRKSYKFGSKRPEFYKSREFYGGTILWVGIHALDLAWFFGGPLNIVSAMHSRRDNFGYGDCESSSMVAFAGRDGGLIGSLTADYYQPQSSDRHGDDQIRVAGEGGVIEVAHGKARLTTHDKKTVELAVNPGPGFFYEFCREVQGDGKCRVSMEETFEVTAAALTARDMADKNMTRL
jgi:predicted dehydrogenase